MEPSAVPSLAPLGTAVLAGALIGLEREWRGRSAGFRTHILVCLAAALLMQVGVSQGDWMFSTLPGAALRADPARMAHGVLTGIGFLCAGVIFRSGFSVHGLTTAASLWITTALGLAFGAGLYPLGAAATLATLGVLVGLRIVGGAVPDRPVIDVVVSWRPEPGESPIDAVEAVLAELTGSAGRSLQSMDRSAGISRHRYRLRAPRGALPAMGRRLGAIAGVRDFTLDVRDD